MLLPMLSSHLQVSCTPVMSTKVVYNFHFFFLFFFKITGHLFGEMTRQKRQYVSKWLPDSHRKCLLLCCRESKNCAWVQQTASNVKLVTRVSFCYEEKLNCFLRIKNKIKNGMWYSACQNNHFLKLFIKNECKFLTSIHPSITFLLITG